MCEVHVYVNEAIRVHSLEGFGPRDQECKYFKPALWTIPTGSFAVHTAHFPKCNEDPQYKLACFKIKFSFFLDFSLTLFNKALSSGSNRCHFRVLVCRCKGFHIGRYLLASQTSKCQCLLESEVMGFKYLLTTLLGKAEALNPKQTSEKPQFPVSSGALACTDGGQVEGLAGLANCFYLEA